jgi:hypothetical protein
MRPYEVHNGLMCKQCRTVPERQYFTRQKLKNASVQFRGKHCRHSTGTQELLHDFAQQSKCDDLVSTTTVQSLDSDIPRRSNSDTQPGPSGGVCNTAGI